MATTPNSSPLRTSLAKKGRSNAGRSPVAICFSHLRWGFVWQRPQHLLTRIAARHPVYYVEEPLIRERHEAPRLLVATDAGITILTPSLPKTRQTPGGFSVANNILVQQLLSEYFRSQSTGPDVISWYNTPMAFGALPSELDSTLTIYDAMDNPANIGGSCRERKDQERRLLRNADLVFTAGPSLFDAYKFRHARTFCFPSGVDAAHFSTQPRSRPGDLPEVTSPILGYFGVLDERIDFELVEGIADARPEWSIVMIGPVIKIDRSRLAHRPNIHYLGMKRYEDLPRYLAHFDAAILPLAINDATHFLSPSKTLEYLAGGKPVVSTALDDVIELYEDVVDIATGPEEFVTSIERLWNESSDERMRRSGQVHSVLAQHNWDVVAARMLRLMHDALNNELTFEKVLREAAIRATPNFQDSAAQRSQ